MMAAELSLPLFNTVLAPLALAPAEDFAASRRLLSLGSPDLASRSRLRFALGPPLFFERASAEEVERLLRHWRTVLSPNLDGAGSEEPIAVDDPESLRELAAEAPVIRMVNHLLERALDLAASDIHFEPGEQSLMVRCRVDGIMQPIEELPRRSVAAVSSRLKLMAGLDIGEKRLPQDGRIRFAAFGRRLDIRVSTLPGVYGESIVLRLLDRDSLVVALESLGMPPGLLAAYQPLIRQPHGLILVTGPTGSGKTTTLYATLEKINSPRLKLITVEDPVEYHLAGVNQIQVNPKIGLSFAAGLRSIVRQDPDIIMIGEIRDKETAEIAIESALTGHLVFSTLHTNDAPGAIIRLGEMGIEPYLLSSCLLGVLAQRLVRLVCKDCGEEVELGAAEATMGIIGPLNKIRRGRGCPRCGMSGYRGRIGIFELMVVDESIRQGINRRADATAIRQAAVAGGMQSLGDNAREALAAGLTTPEEIIRVTRT